MPTELDKMKRKLIQIEIEKQALIKETDAKAKERLMVIEEELAGLKETSDQLTLRWKNEKEAIQKIRETKRKIDELKAEAEIAERNTQFQRVAEIRYGNIPELEKQLKQLEKKFISLQDESGHRILKEEITEQDIAAVVARWTGIPVSRMMENEMEKLSRSEAELGKRVVGQDHAIATIANALRRSRTGIAEENRPIGSFMFVGPTGVGKTELAKALAEFMFDDEQALVRIDMSEFMESHSAAKFIGSPPGYVGYEEGGQLTERIRKRPYAVILFDEIEKAHPDIFNILLQILDDGRLTDAKGRVTNFKNTIIIMTSNLGNQLAKEIGLGFEGVKKIDQRQNELEQKILEAIRNHFKPEFINRIDEIVVFKNLAENDLKTIVKLQMEFVVKRLQARGMNLSVAPEVSSYLSKKGFNSEYGARPLKRLIQSEILNVIAKKLVDGSFSEGDNIVIDTSQHELTIKKHRKKA